MKIELIIDPGVITIIGTNPVMVKNAEDLVNEFIK